jgi:phosphomannomutase
MADDSSLDAIAFGTDGWRATLDVFTSPRVRAVGQAVADHLNTTGHRGATVAIGYDARASSPGFASDLTNVLTANGHDVLIPEDDLPTPVLAWNIKERGLAGGLMLTASHNPPEYNGVKFLPSEGAPAPPEVTDNIVSNLRHPVDGQEIDDVGEVQKVDMTSPYLTHAHEFCGLPDLDGLRVAYDAMHGSGRDATVQLLEDAGAIVQRHRCDTDPEFGGVPPEPKPDRLAHLISQVTEGDAELGIANDGDADRVAVVTPEGYVDANFLYVALYDHLLESDSGAAVRTVSTTFLVDRVAEASAETVHETPVGFKWVAKAMSEHNTLFGGEESGGFGITDHLRNKDGVLMALIAAKAHTQRPIQRRLAGIRAEHGDVVQDRLSVNCPDNRKAAVLSALAGELPDEVAGVAVSAMNETDGFKILLTDGSWLLMRPSGTEPKLRVYAEAATQPRVNELLTAGQELVEPLV